MKKHINLKITEFIVRFRWFIIIANLLCILFLIFSMAKRGKDVSDYQSYLNRIQTNPLEIDVNRKPARPILNVDYHTFFKKNNLDIIEYETLKKTFAERDTIVISLHSKEGDLFTVENLSFLKKLTNLCWRVPYVNRVNGMANYNIIKAKGENIEIIEFLETVPKDKYKINHLKQTAITNPIISKSFLSKDAKTTQITLQIVAGKAFKDHALLIARKEVEKIIEEFRGLNNNIEILLSGTAILFTEFDLSFQKDAKKLLPLMYLSILIFLAVILGSVFGTLFTLLILITATLFPICLFVGLFKMSVNNIPMNVTFIIVGIAIADCVHILSTYFDTLRQGLNKKEALAATIQNNFVACFITSLTTAIGFYSLLLQDIPPFQDLGLFTGSATIYAFFASTFTLPALLYISPIKVKPAKTLGKNSHQLFNAIFLFIKKYARLIMLFTLISIIASLFFLTKVKVDNSQVNFFPKDNSFRKGTELIESNLIGTNPIEFIFDSNIENGIFAHDFLNKIEKFKKYLESNKDFKITYVSSITDVVKEIHCAMNKNNKAFYKIPEPLRDDNPEEYNKVKNLINQYVFLHTLSLPIGKNARDQMNSNFSQTRVTAYQKSILNQKQLEVIDDINSWLEKEMPEVKAKAIGPTVMWARLYSRIIPSMLRSLSISLLVIILILMILFRSIKVGLISMIPNIWPILTVFGVIGFYNIIVDLSVAFVSIITLGIVVDDTVHFLLHYFEGKNLNKTNREAILFSFYKCGRAIIFTSILLCIGFGFLIFSKFKPNFLIGTMCTSVILLALLGDLIIMPTFFLIKDK